MGERYKIIEVRRRTAASDQPDIKGYIFGTDEGKIYEIVRHQKYIKEDQLRDQQRILTAHKEDIETQLKEKRTQLEEWQNKKRSRASTFRRSLQEP